MVKAVHPTKGRRRRAGILCVSHFHEWYWSRKKKAVVCYSCGAKRKEAELE